MKCPVCHNQKGHRTRAKRLRLHPTFHTWAWKRYLSCGKCGAHFVSWEFSEESFDRIIAMIPAVSKS